ncbi:hypothetical protein [Yersinia pekkanenii]|uniref:Hemolysin XhlA n=1 Tax=Yersinia pekkanenii TaxID=1288385 RepID=A0A0T9QD25_9GAMM|nr:hypothetical protein [Yersinia pekkanenii]CNI05772.1 Uncharacterised protein [Yersinia pekkanenii]CRY68798.1 Uncharacterised protein [Yersinia pekkanenii]
MDNGLKDKKVLFGDFPQHGGGDGGSGMLEVRIVKLEANVEDIKANLAVARVDISSVRDTCANTSRDVAVLLQKQIDIDNKLSQKPSLSEMNSSISSAINKQIAWTVGTGLAILGLAKFIF